MNKRFTANELYEHAKEHGLVDALHTFFGESARTRIAFSKSACEASIDAINFSARASNALKRSGFMTVGDVIDAITDEKLLHIRNLGDKTYKEIKKRILIYGYEGLSEKEKIAFFIDLIKINAVQACQ